MSGSYRTEQAVEAHATMVDAGNGRRFLVVRFRATGFKTIVLQHSENPDAWLSRRELDVDMDPELAVTGLLLGPQQIPHPIEILNERIEALRKQNWDLHNRLHRATAPAKRPGKKRGKRVRRNP